MRAPSEQGENRFHRLQTPILVLNQLFREKIECPLREGLREAGLPPEGGQQKERNSHILILTIYLSSNINIKDDRYLSIR
jgi:hypothetical protein